MDKGTVLLVDDDPLVLQSLSLSLQDAGHDVTTAASGEEAIATARGTVFEVVVCDVRMPGIDGIRALRAIKQLQPDVRTIVITGYADDPNAPLEAIHLGVDDYLLKPFDDELLHHSVARNLESLRLQRENARLCAQLREANGQLRRENTQLRHQAAERHGLRDVIGVSPAMQAVFRLLDPVIHSEITVLLTGETGTGKDLVARAIHYAGARAAGSFVPVHCGAVQESLLESELFGVIPHYPGLHSPTGKRGLFEEADGGTLFLDEVGEMGPAMQTKLLRALQDGEVLRVGDTQPRHLDVRVVAATSRLLEDEVEAGHFRADLYYRLAGIEIHLPPLRERREDIPLLAAHFLQRRAGGAGAAHPTPPLAPDVLAALTAHDWPGNVRELQKELERATALAGAGQTISLAHLSERVRQGGRSMAVGEAYAGTLADVERHHIQKTLERVGGSIGQAAQLLGIHRNTLTRRMAAYGLQPPGC